MRITVALVDDNILFRIGLKEVLASFGGIEVQLEANDGSELISKLTKSASQPNVCIISSQAYLRNKNWSLQEIGTKFRTMKILVLTSYLHEYTVQILRYEGVNGLQLKSAAPAEIKDAVFRVHKSGTYWPRFSKKFQMSLARRVYSTEKTREKLLQFLELCLEDMTYLEMSEKIGVPVRTLESQRDDLFAKFKVSNRTSLVLFAIKNGLIELK